MIEKLTEVAGSFMEVMKQQPLSLALVVMNIALLAVFYFILTTVATQREREITQMHQEQKEVRDMLAKCVVPERHTSYDPFTRSLIRLKP